MAALILLCLCVDNSENRDTTPGTTEYSTGKQNTSTTAALVSGGGCVRFTCEGSIEIWEEEENAGIAYCDGREAARIACPADERVDTSTGHTIGEYSMCCTATPPADTCERCDDGTACGGRNRYMTCSCSDADMDGKYESCILWPAGCESCLDGTACGKTNDKEEQCVCEGTPSPAAAAGEYASCELVMTCSMCPDGTLCGEKNAAGETCECIPEGLHRICEPRKEGTCDENCRRIGYDGGYCRTQTENPDGTVTECTKGEYPLYSALHPGILITDCTDNTTSETMPTGVCCCRGEPVNPANCPAISKPTEPMDCIETPGFLKDPDSGVCCWYDATCYGPKGWQEYETRDECVNSPVVPT